MKSKNTKRTLLASILSMFVCIAMLIGSTFAWFTDTATTAVNSIQSGTLDIDLVDEDGASLVGKTLEWKTADNRAQDQILWEPGCTYELQPVYIKNNGNLALKYNIVINGVDGDAKLLEAIDFTYGSLDISAEGHLKAGEKSEAIVITGKMKESAGNDYQGLSIEGIGITVVATQDTVEKDSTDNSYDAEASYVYPIKNKKELKDALEGVTDDSGETVLSLNSDIKLTNEKAITLSAGNADIDLNGNTMTIENQTDNGIKVAAGASLKFTDPTKTGNLVIGTCENNLQAIVVDEGSSRSENASVTFEDINITVENKVYGTTSNANGIASAVYVGDYSTATFGDGAVITADDDNAMHCNAYVAYADGSNSVINIDGANVTADGTVTPFATGNGTLNMNSGKITISSNNGSAALMVARGSGVINMTGGEINVDGDLTGGRGGLSPASWGANFKNYCFGVATTWTADDDEAELYVTGGVINLSPTNGTAVGVATTFDQCWSRGEVSGSAVINCKAVGEGVARAVGARSGSTVVIYDNAVTALFDTGGDNDIIADDGPFEPMFGVNAAMDLRTHH